MGFCLFPVDQSEQKSTKEEILGREKKKSFLRDIWSRRCSEEWAALRASSPNQPYITEETFPVGPAIGLNNFSNAAEGKKNV